MTKGIFVIFGQDTSKVRPLFFPLHWNADVFDFFSRANYMQFKF